MKWVVVPQLIMFSLILDATQTHTSVYPEMPNVLIGNIIK